MVAAVALVAVVAREGDAAGDQANRAQYAQRGECGLVGAQRLCGDDFAGERMFRRARDRIAGKAAVFLHADQRALAAGEVVVDDEVGLAVAVKVDEQVVARARGGEIFRADAGGKVGELVVRAVFSGDVQRSACAINGIFSDDRAIGTVQGEEDLPVHKGAPVGGNVLFQARLLPIVYGQMTLFWAHRCGRQPRFCISVMRSRPA